MNHTESSGSAIPESIRSRLSALTDQLVAALGDSVESIIVYGDVVKGEGFAVGHGNVNIAIILKEVTIELLDKATPILREGRDIKLATMIQTVEDLKSSTDVFPIKFLDMQRAHELLHGQDVLAELSISNEHLRLRCEQQLKNLHLRLRSFYIQRSGDAKLLRETLENAIGALVADLATLLELKTGSFQGTPNEVINSASTEFDLPQETMNEILWLRRSDENHSATELKRMYGQLMSAVAKAAQIADTL